MCDGLLPCKINKAVTRQTNPREPRSAPGKKLKSGWNAENGSNLGRTVIEAFFCDGYDLLLSMKS